MTVFASFKHEEAIGSYLAQVETAGPSYGVCLCTSVRSNGSNLNSSLIVIALELLGDEMESPLQKSARFPEAKSSFRLALMPIFERAEIIRVALRLSPPYSKNPS